MASKGVLYCGVQTGIGDINSIPIYKKQCFNIKNYTYASEKTLSVDNVPSGANEGEWKVIISSLPDGGMKDFYKQFKDNTELFQYSFFFEPVFNDWDRLVGYGSATVVEGIIVNIEEIFDTLGGNSGESQEERMQMILYIKPKRVSFIGNSNDRTVEYE